MAVPTQVSAQTVAACGAIDAAEPPEKQLTSTGLIEFGAISSKGVGICVFTKAANSYLPASASTGVHLYVKLSWWLAVNGIDFHDVNLDSSSRFRKRSTPVTL